MNNQFLIATIRNAHDGFLRTVQAVPDDKMSWKPLDNGRPVLDLLGETAQVTGMVAELALTRGEIKPSYEKFAKLKEERKNWTREDGMAALEENSQKLYATIGDLSEEELAQPVTMEIGGGMTMPLAGWIMMAYRTFISRFAQINYIQTLYGDFDSH
jgi:hypothetical protein